MSVETRLREGCVRASAALARERRDVAREEHGLGAGFDGEVNELALGAAVADDERAAASAQGAVEVRQRLEQELSARTGGMTTVQEAVVEAEDRHHLVMVGERRTQGGVVVQAQVAPKPDEGGHHIGVRMSATTGSSRAGPRAAPFSLRGA